MAVLVVPADLDSLSVIRQREREAAQEAGLDGEESYRLTLAVDEIATNIITHGYREAGLQGRLELVADVDERNLTVTLRDTGIAFDPGQAADPRLEKPVEERDIGGLGIFLTVKNVDEYSYRRIGEENCNIFVMHRKPAP